MKKVTINTEFIKLDQFLKWVGAVSSGAEAKFIISEGYIEIDGEMELRRGRKLYPGYVVSIDEGDDYQIVEED